MIEKESTDKDYVCWTHSSINISYLGREVLKEICT